MLPPHWVSGRIKQASDCPDTGNIPGGVNPGESLQGILRTQNISLLWCQWPGDMGSRRSRELGDLSLVQLVQLPGACRYTGPVLVLTMTGPGPSSCLCHFSAMMFPVNNAFSQTAYGLGRV